jgi:hypothetical protein
MEIDPHFMLRSEEKMNHSISWSDLPPAQAGVAAALRRAFALPAEETERQFRELIRKLC